MSKFKISAGVLPLVRAMIHAEISFKTQDLVKIHLIHNSSKIPGGVRTSIFAASCSFSGIYSLRTDCAMVIDGYPIYLELCKLTFSLMNLGCLTHVSSRLTK